MRSCLIVLVFLAGCGLDQTEYSEPMTEIGQVYDTAFVPAGHGRDTAVGFNTGEGGGVTITPVSIRIPERYAIVFKCPHGKFVIDGESARELYGRLDRGDDVRIIYREVIRVTSEGDRSVIDLDFLDAVKLPAKAESGE